MAGIYIHIPFCRQACHYCNFHFATSLRYKNEMVASLLKEMALRREYFGNETVETIYFGGGTPSLLEPTEIQALIERVAALFAVAGGAEITLEANPDDMTQAKLAAWQSAGINRLSVGVQSFFQEDLEWMHRAHDAHQAQQAVEMALRLFPNITIDLIYGLPGFSNEKWQHNVDRAISLGVPHLSCYALTVEARTALQKLIAIGKTSDVDPDLQSQQFLLLMQWLGEAGYEHYEISNFAKPGYRSRHNSSYWQGRRYLGIGPSAHSFDGVSRQWNVASNKIYIESLQKGEVPFEKEVLTEIQQVNEYIMTSLRTSEGLDLARLDVARRGQVRATAQTYILRQLVTERENVLMLTKEGKLLADGIAADLFLT
jgi:oxygen-independent coproporphyrinogen-3 oxidase